MITTPDLERALSEKVAPAHRPLVPQLAELFADSINGRRPSAATQALLREPGIQDALASLADQELVVAGQQITLKVRDSAPDQMTAATPPAATGLVIAGGNFINSTVIGVNEGVVFSVTIVPRYEV